MSGKKQSQSHLLKQRRRRLLDEINEVKRRVQWFDQKGNHDTCHHDQLKRLQDALKDLNKAARADKKQKQSEEQTLEGDLQDGE